MSAKCNLITEQDIGKMVYIKNDEDNDCLATFIIDTENWVSPENDNEIMKVTSFIANVATKTLLESQNRGFQRFNVIV